MNHLTLRQIIELDKSPFKTVCVLFSAELQSKFLIVSRADSEWMCFCCKNSLSIGWLAAITEEFTSYSWTSDSKLSVLASINTEFEYSCVLVCVCVWVSECYTVKGE